MCSRNLKVAFILIIADFVLIKQVEAKPREFLGKVSLWEVEADLQATLSGLLAGSSATPIVRFEDSFLLRLIRGSVWDL